MNKLILINSRKDIQFDLIIDDSHQYFINCFLAEEDYDTYAVYVYDKLHNDAELDELRPVMIGLVDSDGGMYDDFDIRAELDGNYADKLVDTILNILFFKPGLINNIDK